MDIPAIAAIGVVWSNMHLLPGLLEWQKMGRILGIGIADIVNILNIEVFILGGGVAEAWDYFIEYTREEIRRRTYRVTGERVKVIKAELGDDAGIFGAAYMAMKNRDSYHFRC